MQDTPDFPRTIEAIKEGQNLPENVLLVSMDSTALFDNIPNDEGSETLEAALDERTDLKGPTNFKNKLMQLVLEWNLLTFCNAFYLRKVEVAIRDTYCRGFTRNILKNYWKKNRKNYQNISKFSKI